MRDAGLPFAVMADAKRYHVTTFGCQMNEHDSERMKGMIEALGYQAAASQDDADLILFNTCSIRESADERFVAHLGHAKRQKRERPDVVIGVGGCWAQSVKDEVFRQFPFVDVAFGPGNLGWASAEIRRRVDAVLERFGLLGLADRAPHTLSGGEKRLLTLAGVLVMEPRYIAFDEPNATRFSPHAACSNPCAVRRSSTNSKMPFIR